MCLACFVKSALECYRGKQRKAASARFGIEIVWVLRAVVVNILTSDLLYLKL